MQGNTLLIKKSHERCENYGLGKEISKSKRILTNKGIDEVIKKNRNLIEISKVYINMVKSTLEDEDFIIVLTDNKGCILYIEGNEKVVSEFEKVNIVPGAYMDEKSIGTNAMGTALKEDKAIQITANEHYIDIFKILTCSAAPIHDIDGKVIGTLNLTGQCRKKHPHTLGLVIFGVKAIENEIYKVETNKILQETYNYMESIIDNVDKGILIIDIKGKIKKINESGAKILENNKEDLINNYADFIIDDLNDILKKLEQGEKYVRKEEKLKYTSSFKTIINIKAIKIKETIIGMLITLKDEKEINKKDNTGAFYTFEDIIGESAAISNVITNAKIVADSPSTILIQGESGTGKEILAQAIHNYSYRKNSKFVAINCGAIPGHLIESELFGYEEGTFTGGKRGGKRGKFELANGGTLFLDEIGEMPLELQVNLLRVLQEGRVTRLGGDREILMDVRIIAATNKDLKEEVLKGRFREDLYYRLCVIPIHLPALRERKGDVKELINFFLRTKSFKLNKIVPNIDECLYKALINYNWPGNIRQLENYIENLVNLDGNISLELLKNINIERNEKFYNDIECINNNNNRKKIDDFNLSTVEKTIIVKALEAYDNNMSKTAASLGISRSTLYAKIKKHEIKV